MNESQLVFENNRVRSRMIDEEFWFVLADVCKILSIKNSRDVYDRLDEDERDSVDFTDTIGRKHSMQAVNEPGLYHVILTSNSEKAKPFRRWITHEVIPAIRKQGFYSMLTDEKLIEVLTERTRENIDYLKRIDKNKIRNQVLHENKEKMLAKREERLKQTNDLWLRRFGEAKEFADHGFSKELTKIWQEDIVMWRKYYDKYMSDVGREISQKYKDVVIKTPLGDEIR